MSNKVLSFLITARDSASSVFRRVGSSLSSLARRIVSLPSILAGGAFAGMIREAASFNIQMARAWTMSGKGIAGFRALRREVIAMSGDLGVAKSELANGLYQALSAGVPEDNVISFLRTASKVAVADGSNVATAIDGISTVLNAYGIEASRTDEITDKLFQTVAKGKTTFSQLAGSIAQVAPTAAAMGVDIDQVLGAVATLTKQGVPTATAMVQLRNSILILNQELGEGWAKSMTLQQGLQKVAEKANFSGTALEAAFGRESVSAVLALTGKNAQQAADDLDAMRQSAGALGSAFKKVDQFNHWAKIWNVLRGIMAQIGGILDAKIAPAVSRIAEKLKTWGSGFANLLSGLLDGSVKWMDVMKGAREVIGLSLKVGFKEAVNWLIHGMRAAGSFILESVSDKTAWAGIGKIILASFTGLGAGLIGIFRTPIMYLQASVDWMIDRLASGVGKTGKMLNSLSEGYFDLLIAGLKKIPVIGDKINGQWIKDFWSGFKGGFGAQSPAAKALFGLTEYGDAKSFDDHLKRNQQESPWLVQQGEAAAQAAGNLLRDGTADLAQAGKDAFAVAMAALSNSEGVIDTSEDRSRIAGLLDNARAALSALSKPSLFADAFTSAASKGIGAGLGPALKGIGKSMLPETAKFASATLGDMYDAARGQGPDNVMLSEMRKSNSTLEKIARNTAGNSIT